jgi:hypothetical protein
MLLHISSGLKMYFGFTNFEVLLQCSWSRISHFRYCCCAIVWSVCMEYVLETAGWSGWEKSFRQVASKHEICGMWQRTFVCNVEATMNLRVLPRRCAVFSVHKWLCGTDIISYKLYPVWKCDFVRILVQWSCSRHMAWWRHRSVASHNRSVAQVLQMYGICQNVAQFAGWLMGGIVAGRWSDLQTVVWHLWMAWYKITSKFHVAWRVNWTAGAGIPGCAEVT